MLTKLPRMHHETCPAHAHSTEQKQGSVTEPRRCPAGMRMLHVPTRVQRGTEAPTPRTQCLRSCLAEAASVSAARVASRVEASRPVADQRTNGGWLTMRQGLTDKQSMRTSGGRRRQFLRHSFTICTDPKQQQPVTSPGRRSSCCVYALEATPMAEAGK